MKYSFFICLFFIAFFYPRYFSFLRPVEEKKEVLTERPSSLGMMKRLREDPRLANARLEKTEPQPSVVKSSPFIPRAPLDLPDPQSQKNSRAFFANEWGRARVEIIQGHGFGQNTVQLLDDANQRHQEEKNKIFQNYPVGNLFFSREDLTRIEDLNTRYQNEILNLVGESTFAELKLSRQKLIEEYQFGGYQIAVDFF
jgi:hypothetical protein